MQNNPKRISKKIRDKFHADINSSIAELNLKIDGLSQQVTFYRELIEKNNNSGVLYLSEDEVLAKIFSGLKMYLNPKDIAVAQHIALDSIWESEITSAWISVLKPGDTIFDIGANFGYFGLLAAQFTGRNKSRIVFFEANPKLLPYINKSLSINWFHQQSAVENYGVADKKGTLTLNVLKDYIGSSSLQTMEHLGAYMKDKMDLKVSEKIKVPTITIDDYCRQKDIRKVNLIKMDIEGFEEKAYQGMRQTVRSSPDITLFIEFTKESYEDPKKFYEQMVADFGHVYLINERGELVKPKDNGYKTVIGNSDQWVMPVFSKNSNLTER